MGRGRPAAALAAASMAALGCGIAEGPPLPPYLSFEPPDLATNLGSPSSCDARFAGCPTQSQLGSGIGIWVSSYPTLSDAEVAQLQQSLSLAYWPDGGVIASSASGLLQTDVGAYAMQLTPAQALEPDAWIAMVFDSKVDIPVAFGECSFVLGPDGGPYVSRFRVGSYPLLLGGGFGEGDALVSFSEDMASGGSPPASYSLSDSSGACARLANGFGADWPVGWVDIWQCPGSPTPVTVNVSGPVVAASGLAARRFDGGDLPAIIVFDADASVPNCDFTRF